MLGGRGMGSGPCLAAAGAYSRPAPAPCPLRLPQRPVNELQQLKDNVLCSWVRLI